MARVARREAVVRQAEVHVARVDADRFCITAAADDDGFDGSARARNPADLTLLRLVELGEVDVRRVDGEPAGRVLSAGERGHRAGLKPAHGSDLGPLALGPVDRSRFVERQPRDAALEEHGRGAAADRLRIQGAGVRPVEVAIVYHEGCGRCVGLLEGLAAALGHRPDRDRRPALRPEDAGGVQRHAFVRGPGGGRHQDLGRRGDNDERGGERRRADERPIAIAGTAARAAPPHERRARVGHCREVNVVAAHRAIPAAVAIGGADQACARSRHEQGRCAGTADDAAVGEDLRTSVDRAAAADPGRSTAAGAREHEHHGAGTHRRPSSAE